MSLRVMTGSVRRIVRCGMSRAGASEPLRSRSRSSILGRVVVAYVQGLPKGGGAWSYVPSSERPALGRVTPPNHGELRSMFRKVSRLAALAAASFSFGAPALGATTHLKCYYTNVRGEKVVADLALSEEKREADIWFDNTNAGSQWPAKFEQKTVTIRMDMQNFIFVDRINLKFTRVFLQAGVDRIYERGFCKKSVVPKRAF